MKHVIDNKKDSSPKTNYLSVTIYHWKINVQTLHYKIRWFSNFNSKKQNTSHHVLMLRWRLSANKLVKSNHILTVPDNYKHQSNYPALDVVLYIIIYCYSFLSFFLIDCRVLWKDSHLYQMPVTDIFEQKYL